MHHSNKLLAFGFQFRNEERVALAFLLEVEHTFLCLLEAVLSLREELAVVIQLAGDALELLLFLLDRASCQQLFVEGLREFEDFWVGLWFSWCGVGELV